MPDDEQLDELEQSPSESEDQSEEDASAPGSDDPLEGKEDLQKALLSLYEKCKGEDRYPRLVEVKDIKQAEFYWGGRQYIWWSSQDQRWNLPTQQAANYGDLNIDDMPRFEFVTNIYQARGLMMIGAVAGAPPRVRFFPEDADDEDDLETAEGRTKAAKLIQRWNPTQKLLQEETYHAWTGGFIAWWVRYVSDDEKYGLDSVQLLKQGEQEIGSTISCPNCGWSAPAEMAEPPVPCPGCGEPLDESNVSEEEPMPVPEEGEETTTPKGRIIVTPFGALNFSRPQHTNSQSQWHYCGLEEEVHYSTLRAAFEDKAEKIKPGLNQGADDVFERNARLSVAENTKLLTQTGANQASLCTFVRAWFRKSAFWMIDDEGIREELLEIFPRGCRVEFTGNVYCKSAAKSMDDEIVSTHAMPGRGQHRPAVGQSMLSVQDRVNTFSNIEAETYEYGIPITYRASDTFASEADEDQRAAPGLEVEVALKPGENIKQRIMQLRADSVSPDMYQHTNELIGPIADQLTGTYPALSGAGADQGAPDTAMQQGMQRDQAMGRMGIFYVNLKQAHADVMTLACRALEENANGTLKVPILAASGEFESESVDVTALEGEAEAYPEGDENFPELWNQQRATMQQIMDSPYGAELVKEPENAELFARLTGIPDLKIPGIDARRKQLKEIAQLTKIPKQEDELLAGIAPMVEVDSDDDHAVESATCKSWMNGEKGQKMKQVNPMGWQAVKEHKAQHDAAIPKPEPQQKPGSISITSALKDMPPEAQAQWLEKEYGIKLDPSAFVQQIAFERAKKGTGEAKPAPGGPHQGAPPTGEGAERGSIAG
jgi:hypothetical protein